MAELPTLRKSPKPRIARMPNARQRARIHRPDCPRAERTVETPMAMSGPRRRFSGFRGAHSPGHCYFALKDEGAKIEAVIWKFAHGAACAQAAGRARGDRPPQLTTYPGSSKYRS